MIFDYEEAKELLTSQGKFYINLGLERTAAALNILDNPQDKINIIHIAGTNGKGSVCAMLSNVLKCAGHKTGLYTSPHLIEYTERVKINGIDITKKDFAHYIKTVCNIAEKNKIPLTEFEILTICAFKYFADNNVEAAVIETGLGGRFDATNVCKKPVLSIITSISLDHTDKLGGTIEQIAFEKAGIIKPYSTVIAGSLNKGLEVIKKAAKEQNANLIVSDCDLKINYECTLGGLYQKENLSLVLKASEYLKINDNAVKAGLKTVQWGARFEYLKEKNILIDGAHNPDGAKQLRKSLDYYFPSQKRIFIYSTLNTKDYKKIAKILFRTEDEIYFYEFDYKNALSFEEYTCGVPDLKNIKKLNHSNLLRILNKGGLKIVTGSLYMIGTLYRELKSAI